MVYLIGITGQSCSGKTTLARKLQDKIDSLIVISQDFFYKDLTPEEYADFDNYNFDRPEAVDLDELETVLYEIVEAKVGDTVTIPNYEFGTNERTGTMNIILSEIVVIEGLYVFYRESIRDLFDLKVYIDTSSETCLQRRLARDMVERDRDPEYIKFRNDKYVVPGYRKYIEPIKEHCDVILNSKLLSVFHGLIDVITV